MKTLAKALCSVAACCVPIVVAIPLSAATAAYYRELVLPAWAPPGWVFGPAWTLLYAMMAFSLFLVWTAKVDDRIRRGAMMLFFIQLALNVAWTPIFFGLRLPGVALAVIIMLWLAVAWTIGRFWSIRDLAGALLVPYLAWLTFATALNAAIWKMN
jgi:translocator protein